MEKLFEVNVYMYLFKMGYHPFIGRWMLSVERWTFVFLYVSFGYNMLAKQV
jgi:hypothetical protein